MLLIIHSLAQAAAQSASISSARPVMFARDCLGKTALESRDVRCVADAPGLDKPLCFCTQEGLDLYRKEYHKIHQRLWQAKQAQIIIGCSTQLDDNQFCQRADEDLATYMNRLEDLLIEEKQRPKKIMRTSDLIESDLTAIPWKTLRFVMAVNIKIGLFDPNALIPSLDATMVDLAVKEHDMELLFFLIDHGAGMMKDVSTPDLLIKYMLQSPDKRSIDVLQSMADDGIVFSWPDYNWATHLDPKDVLEKAHIILGVYDTFLGITKASYCIPVSTALALPDLTQGERAWKVTALSLSNLQDCKSRCTIC